MFIICIQRWLDGILPGIQKILSVSSVAPGKCQHSILYQATAVSFHILSNSSLLLPMLHSPSYWQCCYVSLRTNKWVNTLSICLKSFVNTGAMKGLHDLSCTKASFWRLLYIISFSMRRQWVRKKNGWHF
jgi:hypothetical protein